MRIDDLIQLKAGEEVLEVVHEDVVPHTPRFFLLFLWFVVPFFFLFPLLRLGWVGVLIFLALVLSATVMCARAYKRWSHTVLVVTDRRMVDVEQRGLFDRVVTEAPFMHVDEISYRIKGVIPTIFRYGTLQVKLSGTAADIDFRHVRRPARLHDLLNDLCAAAKNENRDERETKLRHLAQSLTVEDMKNLEGTVREREREEAVDQLFSARE